MEELLINASNLIHERKFSEAKQNLNEFIENNNKISKGLEFTFSDVVEFYASRDKLKLKNVKWVSPRIDEAYKLLAYIANEEKDFTNAYTYLEEGLKYNPMNTHLMFEKAETAKFMKDYDKMYTYTKEMYDYIYKCTDFARYLRLLGYYYTEMEKYDIAYSIYIVSLYYENLPIAHNEIEYIKSKLNNKLYKLSTEEIVDILKKEKIKTIISDENIVCLSNFINDKTLKEKVPELVEAVSNNLDIFLNSTNINDLTAALTYEMPKISFGEVYDVNKIHLDELDKSRINNNISKMKKENLKFSFDQAVPINSTTNLLDKNDIHDRALRIYAMATFATMGLNKKEDLIDNKLEELDKKYNVRKVLNQHDLDYIGIIKSKQVSKSELSNMTYLYNGVNTLFWTLNLTTLTFNKADIKSLEVALGSNEYNLREKEELLEIDDLVSRYLFSNTTKYDFAILKEIKNALDFALDYKIDKILKDNLDVTISKTDFCFNVEFPNKLMFNRIDYMTRPYDLFELKGNDTYILFTDLGIHEIENGYNEEITSYKKYNWKVVSEYTLYATNISSEIKEVIMSNNKVSIINYYFMLENHLVCLSANYKEENIDMLKNILFSIKTIKTN